MQEIRKWVRTKLWEVFTLEFLCNCGIACRKLSQAGLSRIHTEQTREGFTAAVLCTCKGTYSETGDGDGDGDAEGYADGEGEGDGDAADGPGMAMGMGMGIWMAKQMVMAMGMTMGMGRG